MNVHETWSSMRPLLYVGLGLCSAIAVVALACTSPLRVKVFDPRFRMLTAKVLRSTNDTFYLGNQMEGRLRDFLRQRCHLSVKPLANVASLGKPGERAVFAIRFSLKSYRNNPSALDAELRDTAGAVMPVRTAMPFGGRPVSGNTYWELLNLDDLRTKAGNYKLRFTQEGVCLAEVEIKDLPPVKPVQHKPFTLGPNAF
jgi:hypothetical protein